MKSLSFTLLLCLFSIISYAQAPAPITGPSSVCVGSTITLSDITPGGVWSSSAGAVATTAASGSITGGAPGVTVISYTTAGGTAEYYVTVNATPLPIAGPDHVCQGSITSPLLAEPIPSGTWSSSPAGVVAVFPTVSPVLGAAVLGVTAGTATITYTTSGCPPAYLLFTVNPKPAPITGPSVICSGIPITLHDATAGGTWVSTGISDSITVDSISGIVNGTVAGKSAAIFYRLPTGCLQNFTVNVDLSPGPITGRDSICVGTSTLLADTSAGGIWTSSALAVAQVIDLSGVVHGISSGAVTISYTLPTGCAATKAFTVSPLVPASVSVAQSPVTMLCANDSITLTATGVNAGLSPVFVWDSFGVTKASGTSVYGFRPTHSDVIFVTMIVQGVCAVHDTVIDTVPVNIYPVVVAPSITVSLDPGLSLTAYLGQTYTFFSSVVFGGTVQTYQWYLNGTAIPGATASSMSVPIYNEADIYCKVGGNAPCDSSMLGGVSNHITIHAPFVQVNSLSGLSNGFLLFPNPNSGNFTLSSSALTDKEVYYEVADMVGRVVYTGTAIPQGGKIDQQISLGGTAAGSYLLRVVTEKGTEVLHFVVEK